MSTGTNFDQLKLENQLCFPFYAVSRLIIRAYQPYLDKLGITYPQYLVMLVLWENDGLAVHEISKKLILNTNTLTPLLKRLQAMGLVSRNRSGNDERKVIIHLSAKGRQMQTEAAHIPAQLSADLNTELLNTSDLIQLKQKLQLIIQAFTNN